MGVVAAAAALLGILNNSSFTLPTSATSHNTWSEFICVCTWHSEETRQARVDFDKVV